MKILIINAGSSSLKYQFMESEGGEVFAKGLCERIGIALSGGADLVLELPTPWACAPAERFAQGGVAVLEAAGVVTWAAPTLGRASGSMALPCFFSARRYSTARVFWGPTGEAGGFCGRWWSGRSCPF